MRVHAGGGEQQIRMRARQRQRMLAAFLRRTGHDHLLDAVLLRTREHVVEIMPERFVGEIGADVYEVHGEPEIENRESVTRLSVIPAQAGTQCLYARQPKSLGLGLRRGDEENAMPSRAGALLQ